MDSELDALERAVHAKAKRRRYTLIGLAVLAALAFLLPCLYIVGAVGGEMRDSAVRGAERRAEYGHVATPEQIALVDAAATALEADLSTRIGPWHEAMRRAPHAVPDEGVRCPFTLPVRQPAEAQRGGSFNNLDSFSAFVVPGHQSFPHVIVRGELPAEPPRVERARETAQELREQIRTTRRLVDHESTVRRAQSLQGDFWSYDVAVFPSEYVPPMADAVGSSFSPGHMRGRAVLYDYSTRRVACAADFEAATTSQHVEYRAQLFQGGMTLDSMLRNEFAVEVERAIGRAMRWGASFETSDPDEAP
ncbi:MAG: hypothetical protein KF901_17850 [Myxococcales bacterium]|nr:hypothetical protein [Myxococcales bacterium]